MTRRPLRADHALGQVLEAVYTKACCKKETEMKEVAVPVQGCPGKDFSVSELHSRAKERQTMKSVTEKRKKSKQEAKEQRRQDIANQLDLSRPERQRL